MENKSQILNMDQTNKNKIWDPCENLFLKYKEGNYAVLILNTFVKFHPNFLLPLWKEAKVRVTVDGGTERWLSWLKRHYIDFSQVKPPELVTGDMDSLSKDILDYFVNSTSSQVVRTPDQNETDFTKSLRELNTYCILQDTEVDTVYVIADSSGRFDHILANINTLYKATKILKKAKVFIVAPSSITWLLTEGTHVINIPLKLRQSHEWCAVIPLGSPSCVTTTGLKWNLDKTKIEFGGLISTSNTYDDISSKVSVCTDNTIVWSMGIESLFEE